ncbi:MAG: recombinase family protein [Elusimicrobia bacterium]|nr:recombinase family protein [Elusimicrobiota bacterium]
MPTSNTPKIDAHGNQKPTVAVKTDAPEKQRPTRCAIYTRVSTDQQAELEYNSCEAQEDRIRSFIASQEGFVVGGVYTDPGYTGANTDRPGLRHAISDVQAGLIDMVIVYKIDRLTRSPRDFYQLIEVFEAHKVGFISVTERFDTSTPAGRLLRNIMLTFAQFERELSSERVRDKVVQRFKRGLYVGGCPAHGYKAEKGGLALDPPRDEEVRLIFETYVKTRSIRGVLRALKEKGIVSRKGNPFTDSTVWHMLKKRIYTGAVVHKGATHPGQHPAIISKELFDHVQEIISKGPRRGPDHSILLPYAGLISCEECGSSMTVAFTNKVTKRGQGRKYYYYRCSTIGHKGWNSCATKQIGADRFHETIQRNIHRISMDPDYLENLLFKVKIQTQSVDSAGYEPSRQEEGLTVQNVQNHLQGFLRICARKPGIEKSLGVRGHIQQIRYSKKRVCVDFRIGRPPVGELQNGVTPAAATLPAAPPACPPALKRKESNRLSQSDPFPSFDAYVNGGVDGI